MKHLRLKTGDEVVIIAGKDKGKQGKILQTFPVLGRVVVEGANMAKRHLKTRKAGERGQTVTFAMPLHASNVQLIGADGKAMRHSKRPTA